MLKEEGSTQNNKKDKYSSQSILLNIKENNHREKKNNTNEIKSKKLARRITAISDL